MPDDQPPRLTPDQASGIAASEYGLEAAAERLPGYSAQNFRLETGDGTRFVLKFAGTEQSEAAVEFENRLLDHLAAASLPFRTPEVIKTLSGHEIGSVQLGASRLPAVRLLTYLPGTVWAASERPLSIFTSLGEALARLDNCLQDFDHPAVKRNLDWDVLHAERQREFIPVITSPARRRLAERAFQLFSNARARCDPALRRTIIHGDANNHNLLVTNGTVTGFLDFSDAAHNYSFCDLAVALAYAMLDHEEPLESAAEAVRAYHRVRPLTNEEIENLFPFACGRLIQSAIFAARKHLEEPDNDYLFVTEAPAWKLLERLVEIPPEAAYETFRQACKPGAEP